MEMVISFSKQDSAPAHSQNYHWPWSHCVWLAVCRVVSRRRGETPDPTTQIWASLRPLISAGVCVSVRRITLNWGESVGVPAGSVLGWIKSWISSLVKTFRLSVDRVLSVCPLTLTSDSHVSLMLDAQRTDGRELPLQHLSCLSFIVLLLTGQIMFSSDFYRWHWKFVHRKCFSRPSPINNYTIQQILVTLHLQGQICCGEAW